jgi:hypothetical protein
MPLLLLVPKLATVGGLAAFGVPGPLHAASPIAAAAATTVNTPERR